MKWDIYLSLEIQTIGFLDIFVNCSTEAIALNGQQKRFVNVCSAIINLMNMIQLKYIIFHHYVFPTAASIFYLPRLFIAPQLLKMTIMDKPNPKESSFKYRWMPTKPLHVLLVAANTKPLSLLINMLCQNRTFFLNNPHTNLWYGFFYRIVRIDFFYKLKRHKKKKKFMISCFL